MAGGAAVSDADKGHCVVNVDDYVSADDSREEQRLSPQAKDEVEPELGGQDRADEVRLTVQPPTAEAVEHSVLHVDEDCAGEEPCRQQTHEAERIDHISGEVAAEPSANPQHAAGAEPTLNTLATQYLLQARLVLSVQAAVAVVLCVSLIYEGSVFYDHNDGEPCTRQDERLVCSGFILFSPGIIFFVACMHALVSICAWGSTCRVAKHGIADVGKDIGHLLVTSLALMAIFIGHKSFFSIITWPTSDMRARISNLVMIGLTTVFFACFIFNHRCLSRIVRKARAIRGKAKRTQEVDSLPVKAFGSLSVRAGSDECIICLTDFTPEDKVIQLPCRHVFCADCIKEWLIEDRKRRTCPVRCRQNPFSGKVPKPKAAPAPRREASPTDHPTPDTLVAEESIASI